LARAVDGEIHSRVCGWRSLAGGIARELEFSVSHNQRPAALHANFSDGDLQLQRNVFLQIRRLRHGSDTALRRDVSFHASVNLVVQCLAGVQTRKESDLTVSGRNPCDTKAQRNAG